MRIRAGWSGEMANQSWRKADVDCDESDLQRLANEHGFDVARLTNAQAYQLLEAEANRLLIGQLIARFPPFNTPEYQAEFRSYHEALMAQVAAVKQWQA
jgi:hypothetical protein